MGLGSRKERKQKSPDDKSVLGYVTIYKYGKLFAPAVHQKFRRTRSEQRANHGSLLDRPGLISKIHSLLEIHRELRKENCKRKTKCSIGVHYSLLKAIRLCFEQKICESKLYPVGNLFLELFLCTGNTSSIFSILLEGQQTMTSHLMNTDVNILYPKHMFDENKEAFEYYLQHVSSVDVQSGIIKLDIVNREIDPDSGTMPLAAAVQKRDPSLVLVLLKYGADPFMSSVNSSFDDERIQNPTEQLIDDLNGLFLFKNTGFSEETRAKLAAEETKVWEILSYFRRAVPGIPLTSTNHIVTTLDEEDTDCVEYVDDRFLAKQMYGIHPRIVETINIDFFKPTASLKHLSRCAIREWLKAKVTSIPKGISILPLPPKLKAYVDLQLD